MPGKAPGKNGGQWQFESKDVIGWLREKERADAVGATPKTDEADAKRRKLAAEAAMAEFDLALKTGAAVAISDFEAAWAKMIGAARARLLGLGMALGKEVALNDDPHECSLIIEAGVKEALRELSDFSPDLQLDSRSAGEADGDMPEGFEDLGATAESDGERVGGL